MVCPECGNAEFTVRVPATVELSLTFSEHGYEDVSSKDVVEVENDWDSFDCTDCGEALTVDRLVSEDDYNDGELSQ